MNEEFYTFWYNFDTGQYDGGPTDGNYAPYLPKTPTPAARNMYSLLVEDFGKDPKWAAGYVYECVIGVPDNERKFKLDPADPQ